MKKRYVYCAAICMLLIAMLFTFAQAFGAEDSDNRSDFVMTDFVKDALILTGTDMDTFEADNPMSREKAVIESAAYLEECLKGKYPGEEFKLTAFIRRGLNQEYDEVRVEPAGNPDQAFVAMVYRAEGDQYSCTDSYYGKIKTAEYEEMIEAKLSAVNENIQVISTIEYQFAEQYDADVPLAQALEETKFFAYTWVLMPYDEAAMADQAQQMRTIIEESGICGDYAIYGMLDQGKVQIDKNEAFALIPAHTDANPVYADVIRFIYR